MMPEDTRPTISTINGSDVTITTITNADGSSYRVFDPAPRLYPWDTRHRCLATQQSTDRSLQAMTRRDIRKPFNETRFERGLFRSAKTSEPWLSQESEKRRWQFFLVVASLSILPFISPIAFFGGFNTALSWHTHGEVDHFSIPQRRVLLAEMVISWLLFVGVVVFIILAFAIHH